jgi:hypothetical protein
VQAKHGRRRKYALPLPDSIADHAAKRTSRPVGLPSTNSYHGSVTTIGYAES